MPPPNYLNFDIAIEGTEAEGFRARVIGSPAGEATVPVEWPFSAQDLELFVLRVSPQRRTVRAVGSIEEDHARSFGRRLYASVFHDDVQAALLRSIDEADRHGAGLRVRLRLGEAPELHEVPWEYLYSDDLGRFLIVSKDTPVVRYLDLARRIKPFKVTPPLRILTMIASPTDFPALDVEEEWARIRHGLEPLRARGAIDIERTDAGSLRDLRIALRRKDYHVLHFVGHGGFDPATGTGMLATEGDMGRGRLVSGDDIGTVLHDHRSLRLVVLNSCEGARTAASDPFAGTAMSLVQQGVPAVIAMQFEITDEAALILSEEFYAAIADGYPVDAALAEARKAIFTDGNDLEWGTPVLYLRSPDGRVFDVEALQAQPAPEQPAPSQPAPQAAAPASQTPPTTPPAEPGLDEPVTAPRHEPVPATQTTPDSPTEPLPVVAEAATPSRSRWPMIGAAALLIAVVAIGLFALRDGGEPDVTSTIAATTTPVDGTTVVEDPPEQTTVVASPTTTREPTTTTEAAEVLGTTVTTTAVPRSVALAAADWQLITGRDLAADRRLDLINVAELNGTIVGVGSEGRSGSQDAAAWASQDGLEWQRAIGADFAGDFNQVMRGVAAFRGEFFAAGWDSSGGDADVAVWRSADGIQWRQVAHNEAILGGSSDQLVDGLSVAGAGLIAVGRDQSLDAGGDAAVWVSGDGSNWTAIGSPSFGGPGLQTMFEVVPGPNGILAIGEEADPDDASGRNVVVWRSTTGVDWERVADGNAGFSGPALQVPKDVVFAHGRWVMVGLDGEAAEADAAVWTSDDGREWTRIPHDDAVFGGPGRQLMHALVALDEGFLAAGKDEPGDDADAAVWYSADGQIWERLDIPSFRRPGDQAIGDLLVVGDTIIATGEDNSTGVQAGAVWRVTLP